MSILRRVRQRVAGHKPTCSRRGSSKPNMSRSSSDLSSGFLDSPSEDPLDEGSPLTRQAPGEYNVLYQRYTLNGSYQSLFTIRPPDLPASEFGLALRTPGEAYPLLYAGSSEDGSEDLFEANDALAENAVFEGANAVNLYASKDGQMSAVNVLPGEDKATPNATFGGMPQGSWLRHRRSYRRISRCRSCAPANGSRFFWTDLNTGNLYVREDPFGE